MSEPAIVDFGDGRTAVVVRIDGDADLYPAVTAMRLGSRPVVAVVGGADGLDARRARELTAVFTDAIAPVVRDHGAAAVDGGTDSGVMRLLGNARTAGGAGFPLIGVAVADTVWLPGEKSDQGGNGDATDRCGLDRGHSHFVLVPGSAWGDETPWLSRVATTLAGTAPSVTVVVNGGEISFADAVYSVAAGRPVLVLAGTGGTADRIAAAAADDPRAVDLAASPLVRVVDGAPAAVAAQLRLLLTC